MNKYLLRFFALLLVPCLIADPVTASAFTSLAQSSCNYQSTSNPAIFEEAALATQLVSASHSLLSVIPYVGPWLTRYREGKAGTVATHSYAGTERLIFKSLPHAEAVRRRRKWSRITLEGIREAHRLLEQFGIVKEPTPLLENADLNTFLSAAVGHNLRLFLKDETQNPTGSFKDRSPIRLYHRIVERNPPEGVEAVSTGNHGRAAARAVRAAKEIFPNLQSKLYARVTMGSGALDHKKRLIESEGGQVRDRYPDGSEIESYLDAEQLVENEVARSKPPGRVIQIPHADEYVVRGYATVADEAMEQLEAEKGISPAQLKPGQMVLLSSLGSGGFLAGLLEGSVQQPAILSYGVAADPANMTYRSFQFGKTVRERIATGDHIAVDGNMATPAKFALPLIREKATGILKVTDNDALYGAALLAHFGIWAEATSGLTIAAIFLHDDLFAAAQYVMAPLTSRNLGDKGAEKIQALARDLGTIRNYFERRRHQIQTKHHPAAPDISENPRSQYEELIRGTHYEIRTAEITSDRKTPLQLSMGVYLIVEKGHEHPNRIVGIDERGRVRSDASAELRSGKGGAYEFTGGALEGSRSFLGDYGLWYIDEKLTENGYFKTNGTEPAATPGVEPNPSHNPSSQNQNPSGSEGLLRRAA